MIITAGSSRLTVKAQNIIRSVEMMFARYGVPEYNTISPQIMGLSSLTIASRNF